MQDERPQISFMDHGMHRAVGPAMLRFLPIGLVGLLLVACGSSNDDASSSPAGSAQADAGNGTVPGSPHGGDGTADDVDASTTSGASPTVLFPRTGISADELAVLVNDKDPLSVQIATYYVAQRKIPAGNVVHVSIDDITASQLGETRFTPLKAQVDAALAGTKAQAMLITWTKPFLVGNMSITSAFAMGYHAIGDTCRDTWSQSSAVNPYRRNMESTAPFTDLAFRPTMLLPATTFDEAKAIIDHGVAADGTEPHGTAYLMETSDKTRSARCVVNSTYGYTNECQQFLNTWDTDKTGIAASIVQANSIKGKTDVLFYVQGLSSVPDLTTNTYLPGAIADHLTSFGGDIPTSGQMSAFAFLKAGVTASYGTVVEPCAYTQKFPDPRVEIPRYFGGATLIEAYWKSVEWPAEGIFLGEPLAHPFAGYASRFADGTLTIETTAMQPGTKYLIEAADAEAGPFTTVEDNLTVTKYQRVAFQISNATRAFYRFRKH